MCDSPADRFEPLSAATERHEGAALPTKVAIIGAGIAGISAAESLRSVSPEAEITLISKEADLPYYRLNLTRYLAGEINEDALAIYPESWYREQNIRLREEILRYGILFLSLLIIVCNSIKQQGVFQYHL